MIHWIANIPSGLLKGFAASGATLFACEVRNETVNPGYGHYGHCPPGEYELATPMRLDPPEVPYGRIYVPIVDRNRLWVRYDRDGIGVHGGGSGLPDPFLARQGWVETEGCFRLQNEDLEHFAALVHAGDLYSCFQGAAT